MLELNVNSSPSNSSMTPKSSSSSPPKSDVVPLVSSKMANARGKATEDMEIQRLKKELNEANNRIAAQEQELSESRLKEGPSAQLISGMQDAYTAQGHRPGFHPPLQASIYPGFHDALAASRPSWSVPDDARSEVSDAASVGSFQGRQRLYPGFNNAVGAPWQIPQRPFATRSMTPNLAPLAIPQARSYGGGSGPITPLSADSLTSGYSPVGVYHPSAYQPRPIGTPLSATAADFTSSQVFVPSSEPINYRRLLDKNCNADWRYIVDKIIHNNDQQASIFLQQKLKVSSADQKLNIIDAIIAKAFKLMVNRFGNFLVQRCFEHGTAEQVNQIAEAIRGNTLLLSMDPFGCHVIQKAFDVVPEEYKATMVHELLRCIPETVVHRYSCHVWQKLFELRWSDSPPQIMKYVNDALTGMWHEVALGETGSLVVQNIFENCLEEDKRPCIEEVLKSIDIIAHGQFGNWCIQHICEHGTPGDRTRATDHVLRYATEYSMDQFASKVVEKCLKIGGTDFLDRYLTRVCEGRPDRPRIPLIDIASDQYGNYLIQYILTHANAQHRELVASHIRKHMVSLRGSKFGSRVGMLCSNPTYGSSTPGFAPTTRYANQFR